MRSSTNGNTSNEDGNSQRYPHNLKGTYVTKNDRPFDPYAQVGKFLKP